MALNRLLIVTSEFHLERTRAIFQWVYSLSGGSCQLMFLGVPDSGMDAHSLRARKERERQGLLDLRGPMDEIESLTQLQQWLFLRHDAYNLKTNRQSIGSAINTY